MTQEVAKRLVAVTPDDNNDLSGGPCRALWVGAAGDLTVIAVNDSSAVLVKVPQGLFPCSVKRVKSTGTTAASIVAMY